MAARTRSRAWTRVLVAVGVLVVVGVGGVLLWSRAVTSAGADLSRGALGDTSRDQATSRHADVATTSRHAAGEAEPSRDLVSTKTPGGGKSTKTPGGGKSTKKPRRDTGEDEGETWQEAVYHVFKE